jgi:2,4-dienoyl-CoA reductase (NADPH2)
MNHLFTPIKIGQTEVKNRLVLLGMGLGYAENFRVNARMTQFFTERAAGGVGLIVVGSLFPSNYDDAPMIYSPATLSLGIWDDSFIPELKVLTDGVHVHGSKIFAQISINYEWRAGPGQPLEVVGPSGGVEITKILKTRELQKAEILQIVDEFAEGARRARDAGFDGVEFHFGNGFLIHQFLSPRTNHRDDEYGGSSENRLRLPLQIIEATRALVGADYTLTCRFSGEELMDGGLTLEDTLPMVSRLAVAGLDAINAQTGTETTPIPLIQQWVSPGAYVYVAEAIKRVVDVPVIAAYRIKDAALAESIVASGRADMVGMARALLADPELPNKAATGRVKEIRPCISCCRCLDDIMDTKPVACSVNARLGREIDYPDYTAAEAPQRVAVIGGGPAGIEAALTAARRGHRVTLYDRSPRLGGSLALASVVNDELGSLAAYLARQIRASLVNVRLGKTVSAGEIIADGAETVILAPGGIASKPGVESNYILSGHDIFDYLTGQTSSIRSLWRRYFWQLAAVGFKYFYTPRLFARLAGFGFPFGKRIIILGGGFAGCELADFLADKGKQVTVIGETTRVGEGIGASTRWVVRSRLKAKAKFIERASVEITGARTLRVSHDETVEELSADTIVLARPLLENRELEDALNNAGIRVIRVGDGASPGQVKEAVAAGFQAGFNL